ncbi:MAG: hypothetical protein AB7R55_24490 [Gemmatimonadales bacterium]
MKGRTVGWLVGLTVGFAVATGLLGWWSVPLVAIVGTLAMPPSLRPLLVVPAAAGVAWLLLLWRSAEAKGFATLVDRLELLLSVRAPVLYLATIAFAMLMAFGAALLASAFRPLAGSGRSRREEPAGRASAPDRRA